MYIEVKGVSKIYNNNKKESIKVLENISFNVNKGEFICLLGPSGCGKTTLLNIVAGFEKPSEGYVKIDGKEIKHPSIRYVTIFQNYNLLPWRTVQGNVELGLESLGYDKRTREKIAKDYIQLVGLSNFCKFYPYQLSGGMQQRVAIARALAVDPDVIFMDEPFGALDAITRIKMQNEISNIWKEKKKTILFVTHDIDEAIFLANRIIIMAPYPGRIKKIIDVPLGRERDRTSSDFFTMRDMVFMELNIKNEEMIEYYI